MTPSPSGRAVAVALAAALFAACLAAAPQRAGQSPEQFLRAQEVPDQVLQRILAAKSSLTEAASLEAGKCVLAVSVRPFRSRRMKNSALVAAKLKARAALLRYVWTSAFPQCRRKEVLARCLAAADQGWVVRGALRKPRLASMDSREAVYCVVTVRFDEVALQDCVPESDRVERLYCDQLIADVRALEIEGKGAAALPLIVEHERLLPFPGEFAPLVALCRLAAGQTDAARSIADKAWTSGASAGSGYWFDMASLEELLGRDEASDRAWLRAVDAYNQERWRR